MTYEASTTSTLHVQVHGVGYAYRRFGRPGTRPLVCLQRFRATMDDWDPALLENLARERTVVLFDSPGIGRSTGQPASTVQAMAAAAAALIESLELVGADVLGFSLGGMVAQQLGLDRPDLIDRVVIAGSGSGYLPNAPLVTENVKEVRDRKVYADGDLLYLFFHDSPTSQAAGIAHLARLRLRPDAQENLLLPTSVAAQASAIAAAGQPEGSLMPRLPRFARPALVANGFHDRLQPVSRSFAMACAIPDAKLVLYPDAGHAFLFQYHEEFAREVGAFLRR